MQADGSVFRTLWIVGDVGRAVNSSPNPGSCMMRDGVLLVSIACIGRVRLFFSCVLGFLYEGT